MPHAIFTQEVLNKYGGVGNEECLWSHPNCYLCSGVLWGLLEGEVLIH